MSLAQARWVDEQTTGYLGSLPWGQVLALVEARIIAADPAGAEARRRAAALEQFVRTGRSTEHGLTTFLAKAAAGDVIVMVAMIDRIAGVSDGLCTTTGSTAVPAAGRVRARSRTQATKPARNQSTTRPVTPAAVTLAAVTVAAVVRVGCRRSPT